MTKTRQEFRQKVLAVVLGMTLAGVSSLWGTYQARAAVEVRPELADVGFVTAAMTSHGHDWLFYHHPYIAIAITSALWVAICYFGVRLKGARA